MLCALLPLPATLPVAGHVPHKDSQGPPLSSKPLDPDEHRVPEIGYHRLREGPLQAPDQLSVREDYGQPSQADRREARPCKRGRQAAPPDSKPSLCQSQYFR